jgi:hypothetical protein
MFDFSDFKILMDAIAVVLRGKPKSPKIIVLPIGQTDDRVVGCILAINLDRAHDPQVAAHFKALLQRLLELNSSGEGETQIAEIQAAIAACKSSEEGEIKIL